MAFIFMRTSGLGYTAAIERRTIRNAPASKGVYPILSTPSPNPQVLIPEERIRPRVEELARRISSDHAGKEELLLVGVLRGSFIFLADLVRLLSIPARIDFIALSTYGEPEEEVPGVRMLMDLRMPISGRDVLIVEDIVDTGSTLLFLMETLRARKPASLSTCTLLRKPDRLRPDLRIDYVGFDIPDEWVVGYGMDFAGRYRTLPYIGTVDRSKE
jgi:hypoxanthine phosphoribosyltransferase